MKMYEIDIAAIKGLMGEKGISNSALAQQIGVNRNTLRAYFKEPHKMPYDVMIKIVTALDIPGEKVKNIFFKEKLAKNAS